MAYIFTDAGLEEVYARIVLPAGATTVVYFDDGTVLDVEDGVYVSIAEATGQPAYAIGAELPNGATVIDIRPKGDGVVILASWRDEYVTWAAPANDPSATYWGHYHRTLAEAVSDFEER